MSNVKLYNYIIKNAATKKNTSQNLYYIADSIIGTICSLNIYRKRKKVKNKVCSECFLESPTQLLKKA